MADIIKKIYEIQDIGKGVIDSITEDNLLLLTNSEQGFQGLQDVLTVDSVLTLGNIITVNQQLQITAANDGDGANKSGIQIADDYYASNVIPNVRIGKGIGNNATDVSLAFFPTQAIFRDSLNSKGLEYFGDYESNFTPRSLITKQYADSLVGTTYSAGTGLSLVGTTFNNTAPDQTVSLTQAGATTITGTYPNFTISSTDTDTTYSAGIGLELVGTTFNIVNLQKAITGDYTLLSTDNNYSIKVNNGATPITITVPSGLPQNFFVGVTQKGTGDVTFLGSGTTITNPVGLKIKGQGYCVGLEQIGTSNIFDLLADTKA